MAERLNMAVANVAPEPGPVVLTLLWGAARHDSGRRKLEVVGGDGPCDNEYEAKLFLSVGSGKEGAQVWGDKGANGLGTPAPHLTPTMDHGEGIRCA